MAALYGTPAPIDHEDHAQFTALVKTLLANAKRYKPKSYLHKGIPLVHYAVRTRNREALFLLGDGGMHLNKSFKEDGYYLDNPLMLSSTPLDEAMRTDDPRMVEALFQAGLDPDILLEEPDWNRHPYRAVLRASYEPAPEMIDALLGVVSDEDVRDKVTMRLVMAMVDRELPYVALIRHMLNGMFNEHVRVYAASNALLKAASKAGGNSNAHPWIRAMVPMLLDAGAAVDGSYNEMPGYALSMFVKGMRPVGQREHLLKLLLAQKWKPDVHAEVTFNYTYGTEQGTPFFFAVKNNDIMAIDVMVASGALEGRGLDRAKASLDRFDEPANEVCQKGMRHARGLLVEAEGIALRASVESAETVGAGGRPEAPRGRARL